MIGDIAREFKGEWHLDVQTPSEALRAIDANRPGFLDRVNDTHALVLLDAEDPDSSKQITVDNGADEWGDQVMVVVPRIEGELSAAIAIGAAAAVAVGATATLATFITAAVALLVIVAAVAAVMAVAMLVSKGMAGEAASIADSSEQEDPEDKPSYVFNGVVNTARQGHRIPILYGGPLLVGSMVLSSKIHTEDIPV